MKYAGDFLGSRLTIEFFQKDENQEKLIEQCFTRIREFENKYSRFIE